MNVPITPQQLPSGFCPPDYQSMWNGFAAAGLVTIPDSVSQIIAQASKPSDPTVLWLQLDALGRPVRLYRFAQGAWLSLHPTAPGLTMWWFAILPDFTVFDGGDANPISDISGPMWQQAKDSNGNLIAAVFPIPAGTLPSGTVLGLGQTGGEEKHTLTAKESFPHTHELISTDKVTPPGSGDPTNVGVLDSIAGAADGPPQPTSAYSLQKGTAAATVGQSSFSLGDNSVNPAVCGPHNCMPPFVVGYLLQRSNRLFFAVN